MAVTAETIEQQIFFRVNDQRAYYGYAELQWNTGLAATAGQHSKAMANAGRLLHSSDAAGENVALFSANSCGNTAEEIAECALTLWWNSAGHRANMLGSYSQTGIGVVEAGNFFFFTQQFS